jgi:hypothetical protein
MYSVFNNKDYYLVACRLSYIIYDFNIIIFGSTALGGHWPPQANLTIELYPGHPPAKFYNPVCSVSLAAELRVLFHVVTEMSVQIHFLEF